METRREFEERYIDSAADEGRDVYFGDEDPEKGAAICYVSLPCSCDDWGGVLHWCAVRNTEDAIRDHYELEVARSLSDRG